MLATIANPSQNFAHGIDPSPTPSTLGSILTMRRFQGQRAIAALIVVLFSVATIPTFAQEVEGRPHIDRKMSERPDEEARRPRSEKERTLEEESKNIDEKLKAIDDRKADNDRKPEENRPSEDHITKADEISKKIDLTKSSKVEIHDIDTLLREADESKKRIDDVEREKIANNVGLHAYEAHGKEYGVKSIEEFKSIARDHIDKYSDKTDIYKKEATAYWSESYRSILIDNHIAPERSTMFKPDAGREYYETLKSKYGSE